MALSTMRQITARAFISPFDVCKIWYNQTFKRFTGFNFEKNPVLSATASSLSFFLKISNKKGLKSPNEITENKLERMLKLKYAKINLGYFDT